MADNTLRRSEYWDHDLYIPRIGATLNRESHTDMHRYLLPMDRARNTACHAWGVAAGLAVQVADGRNGLKIFPGTAIDAAGCLIVLQSGGAVVVDPAADPDQIEDIVTVVVGDGGAVLGTAGVSGDHLLTVTWLEVLQRESPEDPPVLVHAPWLRLVPATGADDDGGQVVLAQVTLDDGRVTRLSAGLRRLAGVPAGRLELRAAMETGGATPQVGQRVTAEFAADRNGDVVLTLASGDGPRPSLSVEGATGNVSVHSTLCARGDADISGKLTARATIEAAEALNVHGALTVQSALNANAGLNVRGGLDAYRRLRVRQDGDPSAGISFHRDTPNGDRALIGMIDDATVGIKGLTGADWALTIDTTTGETNLKGDQVVVAKKLQVKGTLKAEAVVAGKLDAIGVLTAQDTIEAQGALNVRNTLTALATLNAQGALNVKGILTVQSALNANAGLNVRGGLDAYRRLRVRQDGDPSAGISFHRDTPNGDRALIGMIDDATVGIKGLTGADWALTIDTTTGETNLKGDQVVVAKKLQVKGTLYYRNKVQSSGGSSIIDHPLDPAGKYLSHSFVEAPEMLNVYSGVAVTDDHGEVTVSLPDFFEALNRDHRFQVTPVGRFAMATVDGGVRANAFTIRTDQPNVTVSWQVTGVRQDPYAVAHPVVVEREKPEAERGLFLHPEEAGYATSMMIRDPVEVER
ncbi:MULTISPECIES: hypothetical protein [unclassified Nonomuraea]|uniref:hypothetical protein n=1 Tax=unclassified Nonomuraea TaxID=2593643 RepID=UPI0033EB3884